MIPELTEEQRNRKIEVQMGHLVALHQNNDMMLDAMQKIAASANSHNNSVIVAAVADNIDVITQALKSNLCVMDEILNP